MSGEKENVPEKSLDPSDVDTPPDNNLSHGCTMPKACLPSPIQSLMVAGSPPSFISFDQLMSAATGVNNMSLAHEIVVNSDFQIEKLEPQENSIVKQVKEVIHKAFWDSLEEKLNQTPPDYSHALVLIEEVKESVLFLLLPQHVQLRAQIMEVLDIDLIRQEIENDAFNIFFYANYVIDILARLCAPVRDERIARIRDIKEVVPLFKEIFEILDLMKMDMANFTIKQIRPYLQQQSVEYERKKFIDFLKIQEQSGIDGLKYTKKWLKRNFEKLLKSSPSSANAQGTSSSSEPSKPTPAAVLNEAYMETLNWNKDNIYPETLLMDQKRFFELEAKCQLLTKISSIQLVTYTTVGSSIVGIQSLKQTLKSHVQTLLEADKMDEKVLENVAEQVKSDVNECLLHHGFTALDEEKARLLQGQICDLASPNNSVSTLMNQRMMTFIKESISSQHFESLRLPPGFTAVETELTQVLGQFMRLISHNRSVFGPDYSTMIAQLLERHRDLSPR